MASCTTTDVLEAAACKTNLSPFFAEVYKTALFCRWKNNLETGAELTCDIDTLLAESECLFVLPLPILKVVQTQLLCDIKALMSP